MGLVGDCPPLSSVLWILLIGASDCTATVPHLSFNALPAPPTFMPPIQPPIHSFILLPASQLVPANPHIHSNTPSLNGYVLAPVTVNNCLLNYQPVCLPVCLSTCANVSMDLCVRVRVWLCFGVLWLCICWNRGERNRNSRAKHHRSLTSPGAYTENYHGSNTVFLVGILLSIVGFVFVTFTLMALCYRSMVVNENLWMCLRLVAPLNWGAETWIRGCCALLALGMLEGVRRNALKYLKV